MSQVIQLRGGTASQWTTANPVLAQREMAVETDTMLYKIGDGSTPWNGLPYRLLTGTFSDGLTLDAIADPDTPPAGKMRLYPHDIAGRLFPKVKGPSGLDNPLQSGLHANRVAMMLPGATTAPQYFGLIAVTAVGTISHPVMTAGVDLNSTVTRIRVTGAATANSAAELRFAQALMYRGESFGGIQVGGFFASCRFCIPAVVAAQQVFVGLANTTAAIATTQDPDALTNVIGIG